MSSPGLGSDAPSPQVAHPNPPPLPARKLPPALPPRPGTAALQDTPVQHDRPRNVVADTEKKMVQLSPHTIPLPVAPGQHSNESLKTSNLDSTIMLDDRERRQNLERPAALDTEIPAIVHTAASSPECEPFPGFPMSRSTSSSSIRSNASLLNEHEGAPARPRSGTNSPRPFLELYGRRSAEQQYREALEELQALEVEEFLSRASKNMAEVKFEGRQTPTVLPDIENYRGKDVTAAYLRFAEAWICAYAEAHLPRDLLAAPKPDRFSFSRSRLALERLYVLLPPSVLERLLAGHIVNLYRWKDPIKTLKWAASYLALWYYDQLPAAFFAFIFYLALKPKLFPPSPAEVKQRLAERYARSKEAQELDEDISKRQKIAGVSSSLARSVGVAALMGGIDIGCSRPRVQSEPGRVSPKDDDELSSDSELDDDHRPYHLLQAKKHRGKLGMYRLIREMLQRFGPSTMLLINDAADYFEKGKNFVLWRRPEATKQSLAVLALWIVCLSILSARLQLKCLLLWIWFQFFIVWPIQDRHPRYRRALNPWWWLLWNVPNDAESALEILKKRAASSPADSAVPRHGRSRSASAVSQKSSLGMHRRSSSSISRLSVSSGSEDVVKSRHFAILKGVPGHLQFTQTDVFFTSIRGLRSLSSKLWKSSATRNALRAEKVSVDADLGERKTAFRYPLEQVVAVKKENRFDIGVFDTDGLQITFSDQKVVRLASVNNRDDVFAYILAHSTNRRAT